MKTLLLALSAAAFIGCSKQSEHAKIFQIWKCDDGTYELQTSARKIGKYQTLEEARHAKAGEVLDLIEAEKRWASERRAIETCGKRVE